MRYIFFADLFSKS